MARGVGKGVMVKAADRAVTIPKVAVAMEKVRAVGTAEAVECLAEEDPQMSIRLRVSAAQRARITYAV